MLFAFATLLASTTLAGKQARPYAWQTWFQKAWQTDQNGVASDELAMIDRGCSAVFSSKPQALGYVDGVATCAAAYEHLGYWLKAEGIYAQARKTAQTRPSVLIRLSIAHALLLAGERRQVASVAAWKDVLLAEERQPHRSTLYSAELIWLALEQEATGYPEQAEATYRAALNQTRSDLRSWPSPMLFSPPVRGIRPPIWDPRMALIFFLRAHGRMAEAMQTAKGGLSGARKEHDAFYFLLYKLTEASIANEDASLKEAELTNSDLAELMHSAVAHLPAPYDACLSLAYGFSDIGKPADALAILRASARFALRRNGRTSKEYVEAAFTLAFELRRQRELTEARQVLLDVDNVIASSFSYRNELPVIYEERSQLEKASGNIAEANRFMRLASRTREYGVSFPGEIIDEFDEIVKGFNTSWGQPRPVPMAVIQKTMSLAESTSGRGSLALANRISRLAQWNSESDRAIVLDWHVRQVSRLTGPVSDDTIIALCESAFPNHPEVLEHAEHLVRSTRGEESIVEADVVLPDEVGLMRDPDKFDRQLAEWRLLIALKASMYGAQSWDVAEEYGRVAQFCDRNRHPDRSRPLWVKSVEISRASSAGSGWDHAFNVDRAALAIAHQGNFGQALAWNDEAMAAIRYSPNMRDDVSKVRKEILELQQTGLNVR